MKKYFFYNGMKITPKRQFSASEKAAGIGLPFSSIGVSNYQHMQHRKNDTPWNYDEFYQKARRAGAGEIDVFIYNGQEVVPCQNELFALR